MHIYDKFWHREDAILFANALEKEIVKENISSNKIDTYCVINSTKSIMSYDNDNLTTELRLSHIAIQGEKDGHSLF